MCNCSVLYPVFIFFSPILLFCLLMLFLSSWLFLVSPLFSSPYYSYVFIISSPCFIFTLFPPLPSFFLALFSLFLPCLSSLFSSLSLFLPPFPLFSLLSSPCYSFSSLSLTSLVSPLHISLLVSHFISHPRPLFIM